MDVHYVQGGVARNIVECMTNLGAQPFMISALGFDMPGIRKHQDVETPIVCHILDVTREVAVGVASMEAVEMFLSPEWIQQFKHTIHSALLLMVDANLSRPTLEVACRLAAKSNILVWFEPVLIAKSKRIAPIVKYCTPLTHIRRRNRVTKHYQNF
uniref:Carbohydrate kinase PfkB domain-containing protein n=1 Tax=Gossypium raimondii TaxID=29730 RepID=A0A0D2T6M2_GOSRA|nr:hypothetical protein B456_008G153200 [Gossypium raimondii]